MRRDLPTGTVTFLFTDVEGSTKLLHELGAEKYAAALAEHRRVIREAATQHGGVEVDTQGDAFFIAFPTAPGALDAAAAARDGLAGPIRVRMGLHSGTPLVTDEGYVGGDVHRAARIAACGHGGQILVSTSTASLVDRELLRDLGPHRLKDLTAPERIFQLGDDEFPPLKSLHQTNLPVPATPFLGREKELPEVLQLFSGARLLTLTGPGGTGKTRLATQAAALLADDYPDGIWWVPLAPLRDPELVLSTAGQAVGASNGLAEHIADKSMLVLFDNFEHVADAAPAVAELLTHCPQLDVLVTSRERLHVTGEQEYPVPPLAHEEGVGFFAARARAVAPDFEPDESVSDICRRLDDLPLALELAAARVKALSSTQILERLEQRLPLLTGGARDLPERQRTLRATIEWSYDLLNDEEQRVFAQLGAFVGGCTLEAAEAIAGADLDTLQSLIDKSLVRRTATSRYWMLETIREYAAELVDDATRRRHAEFFVALAEEADPQLRGDPGDWLQRLDDDWPNMRAAFEWLLQANETQLALRLMGSLGRFCYQRGYPDEGARLLKRALEADPAPTPARAKALNAATMLLLVPGEMPTGKAFAEEALELQRDLGDEFGIANSLFMLGHVAAEERDYERAGALFRETAPLFEALGDEHYALLAKLNLAWMYQELGDSERNRVLNEEVLAAARAAGNKRVQTVTLSSLANHERDAGNFEAALDLLRASYDSAQDVGERLELSDIVSRMASVLAAAGRDVAAARLMGKAAALGEETGGHKRSWVLERNEETLAFLKQRLDDETIGRAWEEGSGLSDDDVLRLTFDR